MPASLIPRPGTQIGPCDKTASCGHDDCKQTVADAASLCPKCGKPIGYDHRAFYYHGNNPDDRKKWPESAWVAASVVNASGAPLLLVHEECAG